MTKALFLVFHGFAEFNGISKKINYQVNALNRCGINAKICYFTIDNNGYQKRMINEDILENFGTGLWAKINKRIQYKALINYIFQNKIDLLYIRYNHNANPYLINALKKIKKSGVKIVMEIPTYPYDYEYKGLPLYFQLKLIIDKCFRLRLAKQIHKIITFSKHKEIFGVSTINISNGIDLEQVKLKSQLNDTSMRLNLICVAEIHTWHGFDRLIKGLAEYYKKDRKIKVLFNIVGEGDPVEIAKLKAITIKEKMEEYVIFHGSKSGKELDDLFEKADMGIASLARHRSNITYIKTLKNREYAARGIPFIYSEIDEDFEDMPYIIKAPANEEPIDIKTVVDFYKKQKFYPEQIRKSIEETLSWTSQMKKVLDEIFLSK
nr:glycosyltransferase family 1 protein [uncultured Bacteroides sp.]